MKYFSVPPRQPAASIVQYIPLSFFVVLWLQHFLLDSIIMLLSFMHEMQENINPNSIGIKYSAMVWGKGQIMPCLCFDLLIVQKWVFF